jgi:hypothetical protein
MLPGSARLDAYGEEADVSQPTITAEAVENDPKRLSRLRAVQQFRRQLVEPKRSSFVSVG